MTDREMMELAAKAAGYRVSVTDRGSFDIDEYWLCWNPIINDGDAFRLAVKLRIIHRNPPSMADWIRASGQTNERKVCADEPINGDPYAATRRAIVRVAAEIGKDIDRDQS